MYRATNLVRCVKDINNKLNTMSKEKRIRYRVVGSGERCKGCQEVMERREHSERPKKTWFYTKWDCCKNRACAKTIQHYDEFKSYEWQLHEAGLGEIDRQDTFIRNLK